MSEPPNFKRVSMSLAVAVQKFQESKYLEPKPGPLDVGPFSPELELDQEPSEHYNRSLSRSKLSLLRIPTFGHTVPGIACQWSLELSAHFWLLALPVWPGNSQGRPKDRSLDPKQLRTELTSVQSMSGPSEL